MLSYRDVFVSLLERDLKTRYKQTFIGMAWAMVKPLVTMIVFSFFFGKIANIPSDGVPYPVFSYSGLLLWSYLSTAVGTGSHSVVKEANLVSKIYFPRLLIPFSATLVGLIDYLVAGIILIALMGIYRIIPDINVLALPVVLIVTWILATGMSLWFSAIHVVFRDISYLVTFFIQIWIYATPVIYPLSATGRFSFVVSLNPASGLVGMHRALLLGSQPLPISLFMWSVTVSMFIFVTGLFFFKMMEQKFADLI